MTDHPTSDKKLGIKLSGVPETLLWPLYFRVSEAKRDPDFFPDPLGTEIFDRIEYDFSKFGRTNAAHELVRDLADRNQNNPHRPGSYAVRIMDRFRQTIMTVVVRA